MKRNLITSSVGSLLILRQSEDDPTDAEWDESLRQLNVLLRTHGSKVAALVYTDGGTPSIVQRKRLQEALEKTPIRAAVVSDNVKARFTSSTVALANRNHRSFSIAELETAFIHLGLTPQQRRAAEVALATMSSSLG